MHDALTFLAKSDFVDENWEQLGRRLIKPSALKTIQANRPGEPDICLVDTVSWWVRSDESPTLDKLVEALKSYEQADESKKYDKAGTTNF